MATKYDAIVIGTGQAGPSLAVRLADTGMKVAIIERKRFGGTCVNNGCIPREHGGLLVGGAAHFPWATGGREVDVARPGSFRARSDNVKKKRPNVFAFGRS